jgi:hypothetical protein
LCGLAQNGPKWGNRAAGRAKSGYLVTHVLAFRAWRHGKTPRFHLDGEGLRRGVAGDGRRGL